MNKTNNKFTVTVGIAAYNEGLNIANLLRSILSQRQKGFVIQKIYVMSDGSSDDTGWKVNKISAEDKRVCLIADGKRLGKTVRLNNLYKINKSDILVLLDADVVLENRFTFARLVSVFGDPKVNLAGVNKLPAAAQNITEKLINTLFTLRYEMHKNISEGNNIFNFSSCAFALRGTFAKNLNCPKGNFPLKRYLFFKAYLTGNSYKFVSDAVVLYRSPNNIQDRLKQLRRFTNTNRRIAEYFGDWTYDFYKAPASEEISGALRALVKSPFWVPLAIVFHFVIRKIPPKKDPLIEKGLWEVATSSKRVI